jgi:hypothetical protein
LLLLVLGRLGMGSRGVVGHGHLLCMFNQFGLHRFDSLRELKV